MAESEVATWVCGHPRTRENTITAVPKSGRSAGKVVTRCRECARAAARNRYRELARLAEAARKAGLR